MLYAWCDDAEEVEEYMRGLARDGHVVLQDGGRALNFGGDSGQYRVAAKGQTDGAVPREA